MENDRKIEENRNMRSERIVDGQMFSVPKTNREIFLVMRLPVGRISVFSGS